MATAKRSRTIAAAPEALWEVISDPDHLPRWWPGVTRVEGVAADRFTEVHVSKRGRTVRMDFVVIESDPPHRRVWEQDVEGSPFEKFLAESRTEVQLEPDSAGTKVTLVLTHKPRGTSSKLGGGGIMFSRASRARLEEALNGLEQVAAG